MNKYPLTIGVPQFEFRGFDQAKGIVRLEKFSYVQYVDDPAGPPVMKYSGEQIEVSLQTLKEVQAQPMMSLHSETGPSDEEKIFMKALRDS